MAEQKRLCRPASASARLSHPLPRRRGARGRSPRRVLTIEPRVHKMIFRFSCTWVNQAGMTSPVEDLLQLAISTRGEVRSSAVPRSACGVRSRTAKPGPVPVLAEIEAPRLVLRRTSRQRDRTLPWIRRAGCGRDGCSPAARDVLVPRPVAAGLERILSPSEKTRCVQPSKEPVRARFDESRTGDLVLSNLGGRGESRFGLARCWELTDATPPRTVRSGGKE